MKKDNKFKSGISVLLFIFLIIYQILTVGMFMLSYFLYYKAITNGLGTILLIIDLVFLLPMVLNTYYTLEDDSLFIYQWPFIRERIPYSTIFEIDTEPVEKRRNIKSATLSSIKIVIGYYKFSEENRKKEKRYIEISPGDMDLFLIKMGGHFKRARDLAAKLEEEHKQKNAEHYRKKEIADKKRQEKEEANKPVDIVVKPVKKNKAKVKIEETEE